MKLQRVVLTLIALAWLPGFRTVGAEIRTDHISSSSFERNPVVANARIEFVGDRSLVFSAAGQTRDVEVRVFDAAGHAIPNAQVDWVSSAPAQISVTPSGPGRATVTSVGTWQGSAALTANYVPLNLQSQGETTFATLTADAVWIDSRWVLARLGALDGEQRISLRRNGSTETLASGDIVISGDRAGIVARIVERQLTAASVELTAVPASVTDAYENVEFSLQGDPVSVSLVVDASEARLVTRSTRTGAVLSRSAVPKTQWLQQTTCSGALAASGALEVSVLSLDWNLVPRAGLRIVTGEVVDFLVMVEGGAAVEAAASLRLSATAMLEAECTVELPPIALGAIPLGFFSLSPRVEAGAALRARASASFEMSTAPLQLARHWSFQSGMRYARGQGWTQVGDADPEGAPDIAASFDAGGQFEMRLEANANLGGHVAFSIGHPILHLDLADFKLIELEGGPFRELGIGTPTDPALAEYAGPWAEAGVEATAGLRFEAELFDGALANYLPLRLGSDVRFDFLSERFVFDRLPSVGGSVTCAPSCDTMEPGSGVLQLRLSAPTSSDGTAQFWIGPSGQSSLLLLGSTPFRAGSASLQHVVPSTLPHGQYAVYGRLAMNGLPYDAPLAPARSIGSFSTRACARSTTVDTPFLACVQDEALRECIRTAHWGRRIASVTSLTCNDRVVESLVGIDGLTSLSTLDLSDNNISDVTPLSSLRTLRSLELNHNAIRDIGPLAPLTALTRLHLGWNDITNAGPLRGLTTLTNLSLAGNGISDLTPLRNLDALTVLYLSENQITDITPLAGLSNLFYLYLDGNRITDVRPLEGLTRLGLLNLFGNRVDDFASIRCETMVQLVLSHGHSVVFYDHCRCECDGGMWEVWPVWNCSLPCDFPRPDSAGLQAASNAIAGNAPRCGPDP